MVVLPAAPAAQPRFRGRASRSRPGLTPPEAPLLLYDGYCALCNWAVRLVLRFDRSRTVRFAPLAGPTARAVLRRFPTLARVDSLVLVDGGRVSVRSTAVLGLAAHLGGAWRLLLVGRLIPREIRDSLYDVVAFWRYRLFGQYRQCPLPPPDVRERFFDLGAGEIRDDPPSP